MAAGGSKLRSVTAVEGVPPGRVRSPTVVAAGATVKDEALGNSSSNDSSNDGSKEVQQQQQQPHTLRAACMADAPPSAVLADAAEGQTNEPPPDESSRQAIGDASLHSSRSSVRSVPACDGSSETLVPCVGCAVIQRAPTTTQPHSNAGRARGCEDDGGAPQDLMLEEFLADLSPAVRSEKGDAAARKPGPPTAIGVGGGGGMAVLLPLAWSIDEHAALPPSLPLQATSAEQAAQQGDAHLLHELFNELQEVGGGGGGPMCLGVRGCVWGGACKGGPCSPFIPPGLPAVCSAEGALRRVSVVCSAEGAEACQRRRRGGAPTQEPPMPPSPL